MKDEVWEWARCFFFKWGVMEKNWTGRQNNKALEHACIITWQPDNTINCFADKQQPLGESETTEW